MSYLRVRTAFVVLALVLNGSWAVAQATHPATAPELTPTRFMRFVPDGRGGGQLQTAIVTYQNDAGVKVHLVAAVHVADHSYYRDLNKTFAGYDALLYELVKPKDVDPPAPGMGERSGGGAIGFMQDMIKQALDLRHQLDEIDYTPLNFIHADLDAEAFRRKQAERGESLWGLMLQQLMRELTNPQANANAPVLDIQELLEALQSPDRSRRLKMVLAPQFGEIDASANGLAGPDGSVIITERNKEAIKVFRRTLAAGKRNIGIFYGAAHLPDMEERLDLLGFRPVSTEWRTAWDMSVKPARPAPREQL